MESTKETSLRNKHTSLGIASFFCSILFIVMLMIITGLISVYSAKTTSSESSIASFMSYMIIGILILLFISMFMGIGSFKENSESKVFPTLAIIVSGFGILSTVLLFFIGTRLS